MKLLTIGLNKNQEIAYIKKIIMLLENVAFVLIFHNLFCLFLILSCPKHYLFFFKGIAHNVLQEHRRI